MVQVVGEDFRFEAPDVIQAGLTEFKFLNKGPALHHMSLVKLNEGKTVDDPDFTTWQPAFAYLLR